MLEVNDTGTALLPRRRRCCYRFSRWSKRRRCAAITLGIVFFIVFLVIVTLIVAVSQTQTIVECDPPYHARATWEIDTPLGAVSGVGLNAVTGELFVFHRNGVDFSNTQILTGNTITVVNAATGAVLRQFGDNIFIVPYHLTVHSGDGTLWVTDVGLHQVLQLSPQNGTVLTRLGVARVGGSDESHFNKPTSVAFQLDGSFYVTDGYGNSRVVCFTNKSQYSFQWGTQGDDDGEFRVPHGAAVAPNGDVYVADRDNGRIQRFTSRGVHLATYIGAFPSNVFFNPIKTGLWGRWRAYVPTVRYDTTTRKLYSLEGGQVAVRRLDGSLLCHWTQPGSGIGELLRPNALAVANGSIFVGELSTERVQAFTPAS